MRLFKLWPVVASVIGLLVVWPSRGDDLKRAAEVGDMNGTSLSEVLG
jgi:hypothetical protein